MIVTYRKQDRDMTIDMLTKFQTCYDHSHVMSHHVKSRLCHRNVIFTVNISSLLLKLIDLHFLTNFLFENMTRQASAQI